jgi:hypothetical protein
MSVESLAAIGTIVSCVVVVVGAFAAVRQLRHLRASNEASMLQNMIVRWEHPDVRDSMRFVREELPNKMRDPAFVEALWQDRIAGEARAIIPALNYWESVGSFVLSGAISEESVMLGYAWLAVDTWNAAAPAIAVRRCISDPLMFENFEHLAAYATRYLDKRHRTRSKRLLRMPPTAAPERPAPATPVLPEPPASR